MGACCVVLVLCGLPGAGKSTLARCLAQSSATRGGEQPVEVHHISFDDAYFCDGIVATSGEVVAVAGDFEADRWRRSRALALLEVERHIDESRQTNNTGGTCASRRQLIVVDDNMYYRSMRHQCYLLAKKHEVPYGQVYVEVPLAVALARNARRTGPARVPDEIIERMHARFEAPLPADHGWERHTCVVHPQREEEPERDAAADFDLQRLWQAIAAMWSDNFVRAEACEERERERRRDEDREQCMTNFLHRLDQQLRSRVASILATATTGVDRRSGKEAGKLVANLKRAFLAEARSRDDVRVFLARPASAGGVSDVAPTKDPAELQLVRQLVDVFEERCLAVLAPP